MGKTISCSVLLALVSCFLLQFGAALDTITPSKSIKDTEVIISQNGVFRLGFFSLANSSNRYVGILYHQIPVQTVVWVANRNRPLKDSSGILNISDDGNLAVLNGKNEILWSSNVNNTAPSTTTAQLRDSGNLVLSNGDENDAGSSLWESFEDPSNAFIETMEISTDVKKGRKVELKSWKSIDDPSDDNPQQPDSMTYEFSNESMLIYYELDSQGKFVEREWDAGKGEWSKNYPVIQIDCDVYGKCGAFGICDSTKEPICSCLKGFKPRNIEEWSRGNWSSGCIRTTLLQCERDNNNGSGAGQGDDGFLEMKMMKVPAFPARSSIINGDCKDQCMNMKNCSCVAYAYDSGIGCMVWSGDLIDVQKFSTGGVDLYIRLPSSELDKGKSSKIIVITTVIAGIVVITISALFLWRRMAKHKGENSIGVKLQQLPIINFEEIATATNNFNHAKKLGQGGFGPVYRGTLDDGKEIAVKRLSKASGQGLEEFMNEVVVISKLQHRNLVRLLGCCVEGEEKILVYEYMPNKSLDTFLFDTTKQDVLDWRKRFDIIEGISRGLHYLHRDSRPKIIHRDLKTNNILLDEELNPKISDFGMAKIFGGNENQANTKRVVGTYGYMPPEYVMQGQFSEKSDVFSFGVLLLEVDSGRRNTRFYNDQYALSLLGYAWKLWREGDIWGIVDKVILESESYSKNEKEIWRCIHIGLLCVQEFAKDRPTMPTVVSMLNSEISNLSTPKQPAFTQTPLTTQDVEDGFANSSNRYVGILYNQIPVQTVVWVANRNKPLKDASRILNISDYGNLVVSNGKAEVVWSSHVNNTAPNATTAQLLDSGNLVLSNGEDGPSSLWESFEDPSNAFLETMKISNDVKKGRKVEIKSWKSPDDPSDGNFSLGIEPFNIPEVVLSNNNKLYFRTGPWSGNIFIGVIMKTVYIDGFYIVADNQQQTYYITYEFSDNSRLRYYELDSQGKFVKREWDAGKGDWINRYSTSQTESSVYGQCGALGICDLTKQPICSCLKGFKPRNIEEWSRGNWSRGCFRCCSNRVGSV
ncbi:hypothetical protein ES288_A01G036900v1 [Gossypium darwinii]|uniref:non-specific serine/threonine protein kinase n=1 Tax=Gossypium darwinii TaxID=34276 RepID=A0A5D2HIP6_GOSDA|nr:hypothetical protein ES288_A01G036900v1 [Gossypium darwinii]